jgi:xylulokinase
VVGCAILAGMASGIFRDFEDAVARCVEFGPEIKPNPAWTETYERMGGLFDNLHEASQQFYDRLSR